MNHNNAEEQFKKMTSQWISGVRKAIGAEPPAQAEWNSPIEIASTLSTLGAETDPANHMFFPMGGGIDLAGCEVGQEHDTLDLFATGSANYRVLPKSLQFVRTNDIAQSFFLLSTSELTPSGVYNSPSETHEEIVELPNGDQVDRVHWDEGSLGEDEHGRRQPLPTGSNLVARVFGGQILISCKSSRYNLANVTYDGRHASASADEIRDWIDNNRF